MKSLKYKILNKAGFSIVETLIGMTVLGVIAVVASGTIRGIAANNKLIQGKQASTTSNQILQAYLSSLNVCTMSINKTNVIAAISDPDMEAVPQVIPPAQPPDPGAFDVEFNFRGLGPVRANQTNPNLEFIFDRVYVDDAKFADRNNLSMPRFIGILKVAGHQAIFDEAATVAAGVPTYRPGIKVKEQIVGAISVTFNANKTIADCTMNSRVFEPPPNDPELPGSCPDIIDPNTGGVLAAGGTPPCDPPPQPPLECSPQPCVPPIPPPLPTCVSAAQCAVYDYFTRNGIPNPLQAADTWMASNTNWSGIATSYIGTMGRLAEMNLLSSVHNAGLVQTGLNGANTIDQWVANAVSRDPSGFSMLRTQDGFELLAAMFPDTPGDSVVAGTLFTTASQGILRDILSVAPATTMNSGLGVGVWQNVLGILDTPTFYAQFPQAAILAVTDGMATNDAQQIAARDLIKGYIASNPADAMNIALGTGLWAGNTPGGVNAVASFLAQSASSTADLAHSMNIARATATWAVGLDFTSGSGVQDVASFIAANSAQALDIANGTVIATDVFGGAAVAQAIMEDPNAASQLAQDLATFQAQSGWTTQEMQQYVNDPANADWKSDLENAVRPP